MKKLTRSQVFLSVAKYAMETKMPLDAAAVNASEILEHHKLTSSDDTMESLMSAIQKEVTHVKKEQRSRRKT